jgi:hypothetical protein
MGPRSRDSYRDLFKDLNILPLHSQRKLLLFLFVTRQKYNFHLCSADVSVYQKGIEVHNILPQSIKGSSNDEEQFKSVLTNYLWAHSFYFVCEYFNVNRELCKINFTMLF